jgi:peptide/nickel transport system ATP-binding protein
VAVTALLAVEDLVTEFRGERGTVRAVDGVSFQIPRGKTTGVVGESGSGKSVTALSILRLVPDPPGRIAAGRVLYEGQDLLRLDDRALRKVRGNQISMIFQEPMTSLNPVYTTGEQVAEAVRLHQGASRRAALAKAVEMFELVGIPSAAERINAYPHQMSGGMRQRVMIAMALACHPGLLIADEPTTALDVTIQAQILDLLARLQRELGMSILLITHDLGVVAESCEEVVVMYAGRIVEQAHARELFAAPRHHYTAGLMRSIPRPGAAHRERLREIPGIVPPLHALPVGCKFQDRCPAVQERCRVEEPPLAPVFGDPPEKKARCWFPLEKTA